MSIVCTKFYILKGHITSPLGIPGVSRLQFPFFSVSIGHFWKYCYFCYFDQSIIVKGRGICYQIPGVVTMGVVLVGEGLYNNLFLFFTKQELCLFTTSNSIFTSHKINDFQIFHQVPKPLRKSLWHLPKHSS